MYVQAVEKYVGITAERIVAVTLGYTGFTLRHYFQCGVVVVLVQNSVYGT